MILDFLDSSLDGHSWEKLSVSCYSMRYQSEHFQEVPAQHKGDGGIEGFTRSGVVIQCYCPEDSNYSNDDLYSHQRTKVTNDIEKFIDAKNAEVLKSMGLPCIKEWHFVVPEYKDKRIIQHIAKKTKLVRETRERNKEFYDYISEDFVIIIKTAEDFRLELTRILRTNLTDTKLSFAILQDRYLDWSGCSTEKVENVRRKLIAINPDFCTDSESLNTLLDIYMSAYISGIELMERLGEGFPDIRKDILDLANQYKRHVSSRTLMNRDKSLNAKIFDEISDDFEIKLRKEFKHISTASIMSLKMDLVAGWLADCSMEFKGEIVNG
ncbi:hypothetical protein [Pseudoneobacillus rhizosphaerae]|uniref:Uncharacterized protein n=1 Tax=Pseudoneobacillus rhizosphaerae TaxID=2880968 RepID=A0A9C7G7C1_9BACI|nr:hypothetical protein [Pseudoneobacillus rhizosphaerae]CAG9606847.1 hypothetical protein NEOCIP111885_00535 [Pseudoneobacillus rhizosphaerae]